MGREFQPLLDFDNIPFTGDYAENFVHYIDHFKTLKGKYPLLKVTMPGKYPIRSRGTYSGLWEASPNLLVQIGCYEKGKRESQNIVVPISPHEEIVLMPLSHIYKDQMMIEVIKNPVDESISPTWAMEPPRSAKPLRLTWEEIRAKRSTDAIL